MISKVLIAAILAAGIVGAGFALGGRYYVTGINGSRVVVLDRFTGAAKVCDVNMYVCDPLTD